VLPAGLAAQVPPAFTLKPRHFAQTVHLHVSQDSRNKQQPFPQTASTGWPLLWRRSVSCEVRNEYVYNIQMNFRPARSSPYGGGFEYLHCSPASRRWREKREPSAWECN
jgi:hypothetical protein